MNRIVQPLTIRPATAADVDAVAGILREAAAWLDGTGKSMWQADELQDDLVAREIGSYFLAEVEGEDAGTLKFQLDDPLFWPDIPRGESAFVHRLALRRKYAGSGLSSEMLQWAVQQARALHKRFLRLDCAADRSRLRAIYENFGFKQHSDRQVGPFLVARYKYPLAAVARSGDNDRSC